MKRPESTFIFLLFWGVQIHAVSLKWQGQGQRHQNFRSDFSPEADSVQIPVKVFSVPAQIVPWNANNGTQLIDSQNTFSLLDLLAKGRSSYRHFGIENLSQNTKNEKLPSRQNTKCAEDIPEWGIYHRIFNKTGKCYIPGKGVSPCGKNMAFYLIEGDDTYGDCDCKTFVGSTYRPLTYWAPLERCFTLFEQGPCNADEWLTLDEQSSPVCSKRHCPESSDPSAAWFLKDKDCFQLSTKAFCTQENETAQYNFGDPEPKCYDTSIKTKRTMLNGPLNLPCKVGHKNYGSKTCLSGTKIH